ncbi:MAG: hypothetical protein M3O70_10515 [Actinomycetota bacterium]|nr:hypothetical protein [Actinomycetota bacterium]
MTIKDSTFTGNDGSGPAVRLYHPDDLATIVPAASFRTRAWRRRAPAAASGLGLRRSRTRLV